MSVARILEGVIKREGGYSNHPDDRGGPTMWGITEAVARDWGYTGDMRLMPRQIAFDIYMARYYFEPRFDAVNAYSTQLAEELVDTGVNMGVDAASRFLQRALNAFNQQGKLYADLKVDGQIGPVTLVALRAYVERRGAEGLVVLHRTLNCLQGARYIELAEMRSANESFVYGWIKDRVT